MTRTPAANSITNYVVFVGNVYQDLVLHMHIPISGDVITFTSVSPAGTSNIQVIQLNEVNTLNTVADGAISRVKLDFDPEDDATALAIALG